MIIHWKIFSDVHTEAKALGVAKRCIAALQIDDPEISVEPYYQGGFQIHFQFETDTRYWSDHLFASLIMAQRLARAWQLHGEIQVELDAWSNECAVTGVRSIHLQSFLDK